MCSASLLSPRTTSILQAGGLHEAAGQDDRMLVDSVEPDDEVEVGLVDRGFQVAAVMRRVVPVQDGAPLVSGDRLPLTLFDIGMTQHGTQGFAHRVEVLVEVTEPELVEDPVQRLAEGPVRSSISVRAAASGKSSGP